MTPGREVAGTVDGRRVVAHLGMASGGYAELALAPARSAARDPRRAGRRVAVAAIGTGRTAVGILEVAELGADDVVLVTAAAGGLGGALPAGGAPCRRVLDRRGRRAKQKVARLDADLAVDYSRPGLDGGGCAGPARDRGARRRRRRAGRAALELLAPGGRIVLFGIRLGQADRDHHRRPLPARHPRPTPRSARACSTAPAACASWRPPRSRPQRPDASSRASAPLPARRSRRRPPALETRRTDGKVVLVP